MVLIDTSVLIDAFTRDRRSMPAITEALARGDRLTLCTMVLFEWLRGPRIPQELTAQEFLFPSDKAVPFEAEDARISADLYKLARRARGREADLAIAGCAIRRQATIWTLNRADFADIPGLLLASY